ncbi:MAG: efflux RND transporter periplasmic adaptor subunit [Burkholderiales bacterium]|nr:efflux RND transporter periplasmic adaptor subunit [Burkholderiales bacterium]
MRRLGRTWIAAGVLPAVMLGFAGWILVDAGIGANLRAAASASWARIVGRNDSSVRLVLLGNVDVRQVNLSFKINGRIERMNAEEGDAVTPGAALASLDKRYMADELRQAHARVAAQQASLQRLENGTRPEEIAQARAIVAERGASLELARVTLRRQEDLAALGFATHQRHEETQAAASQAEAQLQTAQKALRLAEIGPRREDIDAARAQLAAEQAALVQAERRLADAELVAPSRGTILTRVHEVGAIVAAGETVYTLSLAAPVWVRTYVDEPDLNRVRPGMTADVTIDSLPGRVYRGQVGFISPVAEFTPKSVETRELRTSLVYRLRISVAEPDTRLRQGMPVTVTLRPAPDGG